MFCPKCGTNNPEGAAFCGECGTPFAQQAAPKPQQVVGMPPVGAPNPYAGGVLAKAGNANTKLIIMGVAAVAVVVLLVMLVRAFACSGTAGAFNLGDVVTKDPKDVASMIDKYDETKVYGTRSVVSNKDAWDKYEDLTEDVMKDNSDAKESAGELKKMNGAWKVTMRDDEGNTIKKSDVKDGDDPVHASVTTIVVSDKMDGEAVAKVVSQWVSYDDIIIGMNKHAGEGYFKSDTVNGYVTLSEFDDEGEGIWTVSISLYDSDHSESYADSMKYAKKNWEDDDVYDEIYKGK